ncbi:MAG TPA: GGDEF domain-containing protein [Trueperaceae bacterium]|jgi:diguanylate cyclase (GGDEF)-like protein
MPEPTQRHTADATGPVTLAERLLTLPLRLREFSRVEDLVPAAALALATELGARARVRWAGAESSTGAGGSATPASGSAVVRLDLRERGDVIASLEIERETPFTAEERRLLAHLSASLDEHVTELSERLETRLQAALSTTLAASEDLEDAAARVARTLHEHLGAEAVMLVVDDDARLRVLAAEGRWDEEGTGRREEVLRDALRREGVRAYPDGLLALPVGEVKPMRYALLLRFPAGLPYLGAHRSTLLQASRVVRPHLDGHRYAAALEELLRLHEASEDVATQELYDRVLDAAIRLVPGSDSGSLLVRRSRHEPFEFRAVRGYDLEKLASVKLPAEELLVWYGPDEAGWRRGRPRVARADVHDIAQLGLAASPQLASAIGSYDGIQATLCLPVLHEGEVLAVLNLESTTEAGAFGRDSVELCLLFGPAVASLLHRQHVRDLLMNAALTDELTGLKNRRAFDEALVRELARRERAGSRMSLMLMDLSGFKAVNDAHGHVAGDRALVAVADALRHAIRQTDVLSRWGGDEFAAVLIDTAAHEAEETAARVKQAVSALSVDGDGLAIAIGVATAPDNGVDADELLAAADERMYADKQA